MNRVVIDPSTLVSGADPHAGSPPSLIYNELTEARFEFVVCPTLLAELARALRKPYFRERISDEEANEIVVAVQAAGIVREDPTPIESVFRDPSDDYLIALARGAGAEAIITSDKDLLEHAELEPRAISPREACELLGLAEAVSE